MELEVIFYLLANAFRIYAVSRFVKSFFNDENMKPKLLLCSFATYYIINSLCGIVKKSAVVKYPKSEIGKYQAA